MNLKKLLIGAGVAAVGGIGVKKAVDYFRNRDQEEPGDVDLEDDAAEETAAAKMAAFDAPDEELIKYVSVEPSSVQSFLDSAFGAPGRYVPNRSPKVFEYQGQQYMTIWADDTEKGKKQMMTFLYTDAGRQMVASVGYTADSTDYNINLDGTGLAEEVESTSEQITSGQGQTDGSEEVDVVPA